MSDTQQGPDWWQASDGKWYPPQNPAAAPPAAPPLGGPPPGGFAPVQAPNNSNATLSLILGIGGFILCGLLLGIPAIIVGVKARREIRESNGTQGGDGLALGGIILGVIGSVFSTIGIIAYIMLVVFASSVTTNLDGGINTDASDGICNTDRFLQDPDC